MTNKTDMGLKKYKVKKANHESKRLKNTTIGYTTYTTYNAVYSQDIFAKLWVPAYALKP
jgi:ribosomal protein S17E